MYGIPPNRYGFHSGKCPVALSVLAVRNILAPVPGSLYLAVLLTATVFAMATGIVGAAVTVLGLLAGPMMLKHGYDTKLSAGTIAAGGTLGILIPPSVMLVVMAPIMGVPVNHLYSAAIIPGFLLATLYIVYCLVRSILNPSLGPPVPQEERITDIGKLAYEFFSGVVPLLVLIAATLGTILTGMATATEAASCGALGATVLALAYRKLTMPGLKEVAISTITTSSMVLFLAVVSDLRPTAGVVSNAARPPRRRYHADPGDKDVPGLSIRPSSSFGSVEGWRRFYRFSGMRPVCLAIRASIHGPISSLS